MGHGFHGYVSHNQMVTDRFRHLAYVYQKDLLPLPGLTVLRAVDATASKDPVLMSFFLNRVVFMCFFFRRG